jgi:hypothetical protein
MDRTVFAVVFKEGTATGQKANKVLLAELNGTLRELAVADLSVAGNVAIDANIVRGSTKTTSARLFVINLSKAASDVASPQ